MSGTVMTGAGESAGVPQVAIAETGEAIVVWEKRADDGSRSVQASVRPAGGAFSAPVDLSVEGRAFFPRVAIDGAGDAVDG